MQTSGLDPATAALLQSAVHDLKAPAARLRLLSQLLSRNCVVADEDSRALLKHIEDSATAVGVVAEGLGNYAEVCARPLHRETVDLGWLVDYAIANLRDEIDSRGARVVHAGLPTVAADRYLMTWLFQELLANALRFRAGGAPEVRISAEAGGPGPGYISVSDNGPGIEPGLAERVFLPFKKLSPGGGAGLGLTICRKIIDLHGGRMWAEPRNGEPSFDSS